VTSRYDELSDRARWYLNNFDEIELANICASQEASNQTREAAIDRVRAACDQLHRASVLADGQPHTDRERGILQAARRVLAALDQPTAGPAATGPDTRYAQAIADVQSSGPAAGHNDGPSIAECAKADRLWPLEKAGE
jgi:hypothetical protein